MPVRFDLDIPDEHAARLALLAAQEGTTPERLLAGWLTEVFSGDEDVVRERVAYLLDRSPQSAATAAARPRADG